jgi:hypothetical protein
MKRWAPLILLICASAQANPGTKTLLETITDREEIAHQIDLLQRMCAQGACVRGDTEPFNLRSLGASGLRVGKVKIYELKGAGNFNSEMVLEVPASGKRRKDAQLAYLISYPHSQETESVDEILSK